VKSRLGHYTYERVGGGVEALRGYDDETTAVRDSEISREHGVISHGATR
jgi:hypothetical protein